MILVCLALVPVAMCVCLPLCQWLIARALRKGQLDQPGREPHKLHAQPTPNVGGIAIFAAVALPMALALAAVWLAPASWWQGALAPLAVHLPGLKAQTPLGLGVLLSLTVLHVLGRIDDTRGLGPYTKLLVEAGAALFLSIALDVRILHLLSDYGPAGVVASHLLTMFWIIAIVNAMNMLDNMDGLSGGVGAIAAALYLMATLLAGQWFVAALAALLLGALVGFLVFNFPPAKVFMGDGGSLVLGLLLAIISIRTTYFSTDHSAAAPAPGAWYGLLMPLLVLAIPLYDLTSVTLLRLARGQSPFKGDHNHFSHRLVRKGLSRRTAVLVIWLCTLATGISGVMLAHLTWWQACLAAAQTIAVIAVLAILERTHEQA